MLSMEHCLHFGKVAYREGNLPLAISLYSSAIQNIQVNHKQHRDNNGVGDQEALVVVLTNRSIAHFAANRVEASLQDALAAISINAKATKALYRAAICLLTLRRPYDAARLLASSRVDDPALASLSRQANQATCVLETMERTSRRLDVAVVWHHYRLKQESQRIQATTAQLQASMMGPRWAPEDTAWRPVCLPEAMSAQPWYENKSQFQGLRVPRPEPPYVTTARAYLAQGCPTLCMASQEGALVPSSSSLPYAPASMAYLAHLAAWHDLEAPRRCATRALGCRETWDAFSSTLRAALREQPRAHVLLVGSLGGLLALEALRCGARRVTVLEHTPFLRQGALATILNHASPMMESTRARARAVLHVVPGPFAAVTVQAQPALIQASTHSIDSQLVAIETKSLHLAEQADLVLLDGFIHNLGASLNGGSLLPALDHCAAHLLCPGARVFPSRLTLEGELGTYLGPREELPLAADMVRRELIASHALWHASFEPFSPYGLNEEGFSPLAMRQGGEEVDCLHLAQLDLQARADTVSRLAKRQCKENVEAALCNVQAATDDNVWEERDVMDVAVMAAEGSDQVVVVNGMRISFHAVLYDGPESDKVITLTNRLNGSSTLSASRAPRCMSWLPPTPLTARDENNVHLELRRDRMRLVIMRRDALPLSQLVQGHIPRYHLRTLLDSPRLVAFEAALRNIKTPPPRHVLHVGSGLGVTALMTALAHPAAQITALETSTPRESLMAVAIKASVALGCAHRVDFVGGAASSLRIGDAPASPPHIHHSLPHCIDLLVIEAFDCGVFGEGLLSILRSCRDYKWLADEATIVPHGVSISAQLVSFDTLEEGMLCGEGGRYRLDVWEAFRRQGPPSPPNTRSAAPPGFVASYHENCAADPTSTMSALSHCHDVMHLDLVQLVREPGAMERLASARHEVQFRCERNGRMDALAIQFQLDAMPQSQNSAIIPLIQPIALHQGDCVVVEVYLDREKETLSATLLDVRRASPPPPVSSPLPLEQAPSSSLAAQWHAGSEAITAFHRSLGKMISNDPASWQGASRVAMAAAFRPSDHNLLDGEVAARALSALFS